MTLSDALWDTILILLEATVSFEISNFFYFWTDLAEIWRREQILGADSKSEVIFYI